MSRRFLFTFSAWYNGSSFVSGLDVIQRHSVRDQFITQGLWYLVSCVKGCRCELFATSLRNVVTVRIYGNAVAYSFLRSASAGRRFSFDVSSLSNGHIFLTGLLLINLLHVFF